MRSYQNIGVQKNRILFVSGIFFLASIAIVVRLFYLQVLKYDYFYRLASSQHLSKNTIPAKRGKIYAYDTLSNTPYLIATNETLDLVYMNPKEMENKDETIKNLSSLIGKEEKEIQEIYNADKTYIPVKRKLTPAQSDAVAKSKLKGIGLVSENWRYYPEGSFASSILGFVNSEGEGNYGLEEKYNEQLVGIPGQLKEETDIQGIKIAFGNNVLKQPKDGKDMYLTIDRYIQGEAEKALNEIIKKFKAKSGSVIAMDAKTGKILALSSAPNYDPNKYFEVKDYAMFKNQTVSDVYEPGSIFKVITMAAGLDAGKIKPDTTYTDTGKLVLDGHTIMNSDKKSHGVCSMTYVLEQSLNTGTTYVQQQLGKDKFYDYINKFKFGELTGIDLPGEVGGFVNKPSQLNDHGFATVSFGQSISTTPIQMLQSFAVIANKGIMMKPYIVDSIVDENGKKVEKKPQEVGRIISESAAKDLTDMMVSVVEKGHGGQAKVKGYKVAGKTGTAQVVKANGLGYEEGKNIGSFIGFAPAEEGQYVVMAKIDEPQNVAWAESTAAPVVGQVLDFILKYYQVPPTER